MDAREVLALVEAFEPSGDGESEKSRELIRMLLEHAPDPFSRNRFTPGHITCSAAILGPDYARVLIIHHNRLDRWLLPGGHVEDSDARIWDAGRREAIEETGVSLVPSSEPRLVGVDVHAIPSRRQEPLHLHHDLIFAFQAISEHCGPSAEVRQVLWCPLDEWERYSVPISIRRAVARAAGLGGVTPL
jgi:8-oxo-dGTP pyrophosphatase MutT (NUDIX family)